MSAAPQLRRPRAFFAAALSDLRHSPAAGLALFRASFNARHKRLWLSYLWLLLPGLAFALLFTLIRSHRIIAVPATPMPYPVFVLAGMYLWQSFIEGVTTPLQQFAAHRHILVNNPVAHEVVLVAGLLDLALNVAIRLTLVFVAALALGMSPQAAWLLVPLGAAAIVLLGFGLGLLITPLGLFYDDVSRAIYLFAGFAIFLTPIFYPLPDSGWFALNPVTPLLDSTRGWLVADPAGWSFYGIAAAGLLICVLAWLQYRLARPHIVARSG